MYTLHTTKIINRNTEKANFHEIVAFDYSRGVSEVKTGGEIEDRPRVLRFKLWT